jgi:predicted MFS family arabinose efflux permease
MGRDIDLLFWSNAFWGAGNGFYAYLLPLYVAELGATPQEIGGLLGLVTAVRVLVYLPGGLLADRFSRKPLMLLGWLLAPAAMAVFWRARAWPEAVPALVLFGAVEVCAPAYQSYIAVAAPPRDVARAFTWMVVAVTAGAAVSAPAGGWIAQAAGLRWLFAGAFAGYAASTLFVALLRPQPGRAHRTSRSPTPRHLGRPGRPAQPPRPLIAARFLIRPVGELGGAVRALWSPAFAGALATTGALLFCANLAQPLAPNWLVQRYGFALRDVGSFGAVSALGGAAFALILGRVHARRSGARALALAIVTLVAYAVLLLFARAWLLAAAAYLLRGAFGTLSSITAALMARALAASADGSVRSTATGAAAAAGNSNDSGASARPNRTVPSLTPDKGDKDQTERLGLAFALLKTVDAVALTVSAYAAGVLFGIAPPLPFVASGGALAVLLAAVVMLPRMRRPSRNLRVAAANPT